MSDMIATREPRILTNEEIAEIEARAKMATPGPWAWESVGEKSNAWCIGFTDPPHSGQIVEVYDEKARAFCPKPEVVEFVAQSGDPAGFSDADFIAHAREDIPNLIATIRACGITTGRAPEDPSLAWTKPPYEDRPVRDTAVLCWRLADGTVKRAPPASRGLQEKVLRDMRERWPEVPHWLEDEAGARLSDSAADALKQAIRAITVEAPDDAPNGETERAIDALEAALNHDHWPEMTKAQHDKLRAASTAAAKLVESIAVDGELLRIAASAYFGEDFQAPPKARRPPVADVLARLAELRSRPNEQGITAEDARLVTYATIEETDAPFIKNDRASTRASLVSTAAWALRALELHDAEQPKETDARPRCIHCNAPVGEAHAFGNQPTCAAIATGAIEAGEVVEEAWCEPTSAQPPGHRALVDLLLLVVEFEQPHEAGVSVANAWHDTIAAWSVEEKLAAEAWAGAVHLAASDHAVEVPPRPACIDTLPHQKRGA
jgi:hypothetical protein